MPTNAPPTAERADETGNAGSFIPVNNPVEARPRPVEFRLRAMRGLKQVHCTRVIITGHAFVQNIRHGHYELGIDKNAKLRVATAFNELIVAI